MTCSADSAGLIAAIIAANNMYEGPFEDNIILASDCSFSDGETSYPTLGIDPASLVGLDATCTTEEVQQITLVATNCNGETTTATLDVIITEQAPYPIVSLGAQSTNGTQTGGVAGDLTVPMPPNPVASVDWTMDNMDGNTPVVIEIPLSDDCGVDLTTITELVMADMGYSITDNCTDDAALAPVIRVLANVNDAEVDDIDLSEALCDDIIDMELTVTDECDNLTSVWFSIQVIDVTAPEVVLPGGGDTYDFVIYGEDNDDCGPIMTSAELESRLVELGLGSTGVCNESEFTFFVDNPETNIIESAAGNVFGADYDALNPNGITGADPMFLPLTPECMDDINNTITLYVTVSEECGTQEASEALEITVTMIDTTGPDITLATAITDAPSPDTVVFEGAETMNLAECFLNAEITVITDVMADITDCNESEPTISYTTDNGTEVTIPEDHVTTPTAAKVSADWPVGVTEVIISVLDDCSNETLDTFYVEVVDNTLPTIVIDEDPEATGEQGAGTTDTPLMVSIDAECGIDSLSLFDSILMNTAIVFSDACGIDNMSILNGQPTYEIVQGSEDNGDVTCTSATMVTVQATDVNGNMGTSTVFIELQDNTAPELTVPAELTFLSSEVLSTLDAGEFATGLLASPEFTLSDNCTDSAFMVSTAVYTYVDADGVEIPTFTDIVASCDSTFRVAVDFTDACGDNLTSDTIVVSLIDDVQPLLNFTGRVRDYVNDTLPVLDASAGNCFFNDQINIITNGGITDDVTFEVAVTTDFEGQEVDFTLDAQSRQITADWPVGFTRVDYSVTDECGNDSSIYFTVYVQDLQVPVFDPLTTTTDFTMGNDEGICGAQVEFINPDVSDNCGVDSLIVEHIFNTGEMDEDGNIILETLYREVYLGEDAEGGQEEIFTFNVGVTTVRYRAVDIHGNESMNMFTVTINDMEAPVFECPSQLLVYLDEDGLATLDAAAVMANGATDNCGEIFVTVSQTFPFRSPDEAPQTDFSCVDIDGIFVMNITVSDGVMNDEGVLLNVTGGCNVPVVVMDTISPVITLNSDELITLTCGASFTETATIADACSDVDLIIDSDLNTSEVGTYTISYNGVDDSGNAATTVTRTVIVESGLPAEPIVITDNGDGTYSFDAFDGLEGFMINWSYLGSGATFVSGQGTNEVTITFGAGFTPGDLTVTLSNACVEETASLAIPGDDDDDDTGSDDDCLDDITVSVIDNTIDEYYANNTIFSTAEVDNTRDILFQSGESIELGPDFEVELGAIFEANIGPCLNPTPNTSILPNNGSTIRE